MAGVKGKSGGARPNAGRKPKPPTLAEGKDAVEFLAQVMQGLIDPSPAQLEAAKALVRLVADDGKKARRQQAAEKVSTGKFGAAEPPRLVVNNG